MEHTSKEEKTSQGAQEAGENMADTVIAIIDKLAGRQSGFTMRFDNLTIDTGRMKTVLNGSITIDIVYPKEAGMPTTQTQMPQRTTAPPP